MFLLAGLGNPGSEYVRTRHNAGFMAVDAIAAAQGCALSFKKKFHSDCVECMIGDHKSVLVKPMTYMNRSGMGLHAVAHFYKIPLERVIVFHDDLALAFGKVRVKTGGGAAGHNGLKDIDAHMGQDYVRVRIGVHHPGDKDAVSDYVLSAFSSSEQSAMAHMTDEIAKQCGLLLTGKHDLFMTRVVESLRQYDTKQER